MRREEFDAIVDAMRPFVDDKGGKIKRVGMPSPTTAPSAGRKAEPPADISYRGNGNGAPVVTAPVSTAEIERLYQLFKTRLIDDLKFDPVLLHLLTTQPEIVVGYERKVETLDGSTLRGRIARLIAQGYFTDGRATGTIRKELARTGSDPGGGGTLGSTLKDLVRQGFLERHEDGWNAAPGVKVSEKRIESDG